MMIINNNVVKRSKSNKKGGGGVAKLVYFKQKVLSYLFCLATTQRVNSNLGLRP